MKKYIFKILSIFTLLLTSIFVISSPKVSAASSNYTTGYHIATQFTFTSDIDIEDGFYTIQQEIVFYNGRPCDDQYEFIATKYNDSGAYKYSGTYPDGKNFSIIATPRVIESNTGSYIEAELPEAWGQIIYVTDLKEEFCYTYNELSEAYMAWLKGKDDYGEELADVAIFLLGISEISGVDLEKEIINKMNNNYQIIWATGKEQYNIIKEELINNNIKRDKEC